MSKKIIVIVGTRPDAIKLIPVYFALLHKGFDVFLCATFQHDVLLQQVLDMFNVKPFICFNVMKAGQDLFYLTEKILEKCKNLYHDIQPDLVIVQGDTTTSFAAALAAFYYKVPVAHVEAGLRTYNIYSPFPEEANRKLITGLSTLHFAPTINNAEALYKEGIDQKTVFCVGNTGIDSLLLIEKKMIQGLLQPSSHVHDYVINARNNGNKLLILTLHRREIFGDTMIAIFNSIAHFLLRHSDVTIIFPMHPNPAIKKFFQASLLSSVAQCVVIQPLALFDIVFLLQHCSWVITDSGGLQEEAASLGKRILVVRDCTERMEGVNQGIALLVGTKGDDILQALEQFYLQSIMHFSRSLLYGSGDASVKIVEIIETYMQVKNFTNDSIVKTYISESI